MAWWLRLQARGLPIAVDPSSGIDINSVEIQPIPTWHGVNLNTNYAGSVRACNCACGSACIGRKIFENA